MAETTKKTQTTTSKTSPKKTVAKTANKTVAAKKTSVKSTTKPAAKSSAKKATAVKKIPVKPTTVKKAPVKSTTKSAAKPAAKKATAVKKAPVKPSTVKNAPVKSTTKPAAKPVAKKTAPVKKTPVKATAKKTAPVKKTPVKPTTVKKAPVKTVQKAIKKPSSKSNPFYYLLEGFKDVFSLFKNFIHWNLSKIVIFVWSIVLGSLFILPFVLGLLGYLSYKGVSVAIVINSLFTFGFAEYLLGLGLIFVIVVVFFLLFSYSNILLMNLNSSYQDGKKLAIKDNDYFDFKKIFKFIQLSFVNIIVLLTPFIFWVISMFVLVISAGGLENAVIITASGVNNYVTITGFLLTVLSFLVLFYLYYRVIFSYFVLSDKNKYEEKKGVFEYFKESFKLTTKFSTFFKFVLISLIFIIILSPFGYIQEELEDEGKHLNTYISVSANSEEIIRENLTDDKLAYYEFLKDKFDGKTNADLKDLARKNASYSVLLSILDFVLLYGLFVMVFSSFYRRELVKM